MRCFGISLSAWYIALVLGIGSTAFSGESSGSLRKIGGFRCANLKPWKNDGAYDLYHIGYWSQSSFAMDLWKRHGVPYWYPKDAGNILVAGPNWAPFSVQSALSSAESGGVARADRQQPGNGAIPNANDDDLDTYWYAGSDRPTGKLWIELPGVEPISRIRFLGWATGLHAPKDYRVGLILPDGTRREIASVRDEKRMGQWLSFDAGKVPAKGVFLDVSATVDNTHGPVIYELQAQGATPGKAVKKTRQLPSEVTVPLGGATAEELFVLGNVGDGFDPKPVMAPLWDNTSWRMKTAKKK